MPLSGDVVTMDVYVNGKPSGKMGRLPIRIKARPQPGFGYLVQISDDGAGSSGNGNGLVQRGETIGLKIIVSNQGKGAATDVISSIRNESGEHVFIRKGRGKVGSLRPGAKAVASFSFDIKRPLKQRVVQLKLSLADQVLRTWVHDDLSFHVFPKEFGPAKPHIHLVKVGDSPVVVHAGAHRDTPVIGKAQPHAVIRTHNATASFFRVEWKTMVANKPVKLSGWIKRDAVTAADNGAVPTSGDIIAQLNYQAPYVQLDADVLNQIITQKKTLSLKGRLNFGTHAGHGRRDLYIFLGNDKVYFHSYREKGHTAESLTFDAEIPLKEGANNVLIVSREGKTHMTRTRLKIYRETQ
jgi:hypothetical protein